MLTLSLENNVIPLPADFSMELVVNSPFCSFDKIPFSYSVDVSIPINEYTAPILGHPDRLTKRRLINDQKFPGFEVRFDGVLLLAGTLKINGVQNGNYDCTIIDPSGVLSEEQQNKSILDIAKFSEEIAWVNSANYDADNSPYCCFPVNNSNFFKDKGVEIEKPDTQWVHDEKKNTWKLEDVTVKTGLLTWLFKKTTGAQVNAKGTDGTILLEANTIDATNLVYKTNTYSNGKITVVSPFFFLNWVIKEVLKENLFFALENYIETHDDLKNICIYNNFDITKMDFTVSTDYDWVRVGFNLATYDPDLTTGIGSGDYFEIAKTFNKYVRSYQSTFKPLFSLPKMTVGELLVSTENLFNVIFDFRPDRKYRILSRENILKATPIDIDKYVVGSWEISEKKDLALSFKRDIENNDLIFSEKYTDLTDRKVDIKEPVATWEELLAVANPQEGDIRCIKASQQYAEYKWYTPETVDDTTLNYTTTDVLGWVVISIGFQNGWFNFGKDEEEKIESKFGVVYGFGSVLSVLQQGNMNAWKAKSQAFSPRLMIYRGNNTGGPETDTLSLDYEKEEIGILPKLWKNTMSFMSSRLPVERRFDFSVNILKYIIYNKCRKYSTAEGSFIPDEIRCTLYIDHISETTIKGYKV